MSFIATKTSLNRRAFLKGTGATVALPFLSAMTPAFSKTAAAPKRFVAMNAGLGFHAPNFIPQTGKVFRIRGKGASVVRNSRRGDILCRVVVETPSNLDRKQLKLLKSFTDSLSQSKNFPGTDSFNKACKEIKD